MSLSWIMYQNVESKDLDGSTVWLVIVRGCEQVMLSTPGVSPEEYSRCMYRLIPTIILAPIVFFI